MDPPKSFVARFVEHANDWRLLVALLLFVAGVTLGYFVWGGKEVSQCGLSKDIGPLIERLRHDAATSDIEFNSPSADDV